MLEGGPDGPGCLQAHGVTWGEPREPSLVRRFSETLKLIPQRAKAILRFHVRAGVTLDGGLVPVGAAVCDSVPDRGSRALETLVPMTPNGWSSSLDNRGRLWNVGRSFSGLSLVWHRTG
jgi:hypothetical protein